MTTRALIAAAGILLVGAAWAATTEPAKNEKRDLLSRHDTVARFVGVAARQCRGLTSLCPDDCGQSGDFATFEIVGYVVYEKLGEYGDPKATEFLFQVADNRKNAKAPKEIADAAAALKAGDLVILNWRHEYVTQMDAGGGKSSSPERPVVKLQKISQAEADKLLGAAATSRPATSRPAKTEAIAF